MSQPIFKFDDVFPDPALVWHGPKVKGKEGYVERREEYGKYLHEYAAWLAGKGVDDIRGVLRRHIGLDMQERADKEEAERVAAGPSTHYEFVWRGGEKSNISDKGDDISDEGDDISDEGDDISDEGDDISDEGDDISDEEPDHLPLGRKRACSDGDEKREGEKDAPAAKKPIVEGEKPMVTAPPLADTRAKDFSWAEMMGVGSGAGEEQCIDPLLSQVRKKKQRVWRTGRICRSCGGRAGFVDKSGASACSAHIEILGEGKRRVGMLCMHPDCLIAGNYRDPRTGEKHCATHATSGTKHYNSCLVEGCSLRCEWRFFGSRNTRCTTHALRGMISGRKCCVAPGCPNPTEFGVSSEKVEYCRIHARKGMRGGGDKVA